MYLLRSLSPYGAILALLLATGGCAATTGLDSGAVQAIDREQAIAITNWTRGDIYTFVVGRGAAALINWAPCVSGPSCAPLPAGATRRVPYPSAPLIDTAEREVLVYWWRAVRGGDGRLRPGDIHVEIVPLSTAPRDRRPDAG